MPASWRGACKRRGQERAGAGVFIAGLQAPCQRSRHNGAQRDVIFNEPARRNEGDGGHRLTEGFPLGQHSSTSISTQNHHENTIIKLINKGFKLVYPVVFQSLENRPNEV